MVQNKMSKTPIIFKKQKELCTQAIKSIQVKTCWKIMV